MVLIEEDIKLGIVQPKASEVVVTWVAKIQGQEVVLVTEVLKKGRSYNISWIAVCISSDIDWALVSRGNFFQEEVEERESRDKLRISSRCWQVEGNVDRGSKARNLQQNRKKRWRVGGERSNKRIQFRFPHEECTTISLGGVKSKLRIGGLFTVQQKGVFTTKGGTKNA